jgi:DNA-binding beta-propeller fold protein YncE
MRLRIVIPTVALILTGCASSARDAAQPHAAANPAAAAAAASPTVHTTDRVLILANRDGAVAVRTATGAVTFRAPYGVAAPDSSTIVQAQPIDSGTRVVASDPISGVARWTHDVAGTRRVRVVSPGGRFVALVDGDISFPGQPRSATVIDVATANATRELHISGNLDPEAFSTDGRYLYTLAFLPPMNPTRYSVRRIDLRTGTVGAVPDRDGGVRDPMPGYAQTQLMSPDGHQLYTFYVSAEPVHAHGETYHAWVHVLNLAEGWAHCVELDEAIGVSGAANAGLATSPDGSRLFATDGVSHSISAIDTKTLRVVRTRFLPELAGTDAPSVTASDGPSVFVRAGSQLRALDAGTLALEAAPSIADGSGLTAVHLDRSGSALYLLTTEGVLVVDARGRLVRRWATPGDATSIDPAVTAPGHGAYRCAC